MASASSASQIVARERQRIERAVSRYIDRRLQSVRSVVGFHLYERLFALWHVLHLPLFFMLLVAGVVHVIAVHVY
jgi:hypothetical protein